MLRRIGVYCLVFFLTGLAAARLDPPAASPAVEDLTAALLRLQEDAARSTGEPLSAAELAAVLPEVVELDDRGQPRAVRYALLSRILLQEVGRLARRVAELEAAALSTEKHERPEPLVRITVARHP